MTWDDALRIMRGWPQTEGRIERNFHLIGRNDEWEAHVFCSPRDNAHWVSVRDIKRDELSAHWRATRNNGVSRYLRLKGCDPSALVWRVRRKAPSEEHPHKGIGLIARSDTRHVYFIQAESEDGLIKIGMAVDIRRRFASLCAISPVPLRLLAVMPNAGEATERRLHKQFRRDRSHGEWFRPSEDLLTFIEGVTQDRQAA